MYEPVHGNHIGIVINDQDPEKRSRLQVFIPNVSNTVYSGWNDQLKDLSFKTFETQQAAGGISQAVAQKLYEVLPWAEASAPHFGGGTSAPVNPSLGAATANPQSNAVQAQNNPPTPISNTSANTPITPALNLNQSANAQPSQYTVYSGASLGLGNRIVGNEAGGINVQKPASDLQFISIADAHAANLAAAQSLAGRPPPSDGANYGFDMSSNTTTADQWANLMDSIMVHESTTVNGYIAVNEQYVENFKGDNGQNVISEGLFSNTIGQWGLTADNIYDPNAQANATAAAFNSLLNQNNSVMGGISRAYGTAGEAAGSGNVLANNLGNGNVPQGGTSVIGYSNNRSMVANMVTAHVANGGANGFFSKPAVGAKVWVFFYGGDVQKPVYFGSVLNGSNVAYQS
jgi:hypothetical protein